MKKLIALLLVVVVTLSLTACDIVSLVGFGKSPVVGEWEGKLDMTAAMEKIMSEGSDVKIELNDLAFIMQIEFEDDGTFSCEVDEDSVETMLNNLLDSLLDTIADSLNAEGMTWEDLGVNEQEGRETLKEQFDVEEMIEDLDFFEDGYYVYEDGNIYISSDAAADVDNARTSADMIWEVSVSGKNMEVTDMYNADGESMKSILPDILPISFRKK